MCVCVCFLEMEQSNFLARMKTIVLVDSHNARIRHSSVYDTLYEFKPGILFIISSKCIMALWIHSPRNFVIKEKRAEVFFSSIKLIKTSIIARFDKFNWNWNSSHFRVCACMWCKQKYIWLAPATDSPSLAIGQFCARSDNEHTFHLNEIISIVMPLVFFFSLVVVSFFNF